MSAPPREKWVELRLKACVGMGGSDRFQRQGEETAMMPRGKHKRTMTAVTVLCALTLLTPLSIRALDVGDKAPDFLAFDTVGESTRLSDYQGKKNVLLFFFVRAFGGV
jgi:AhpC/TSA family